MTRIKVISLFPDFVTVISRYSVVKRAIAQQRLVLECIDLRQYGMGVRQQVDDYQYGGGSGMVIMAPVIIKAIETVKSQDGGLVILLTPQGKTLHHNLVLQLAHEQRPLILVCGHFEGVDERIRQYVNLELSIGDYVLSGGELPAMVLINTISRLLPGVIKSQSTAHESFSTSRLDYPVYTRPTAFRHQKVPPVLTTGDHRAVQKWRTQASTAKTKTKRPDLVTPKFKTVDSKS